MKMKLLVAVIIVSSVLCGALISISLSELELFQLLPMKTVKTIALLFGLVCVTAYGLVGFIGFASIVAGFITLYAIWLALNGVFDFALIVAVASALYGANYTVNLYCDKGTAA